MPVAEEDQLRNETHHTESSLVFASAQEEFGSLSTVQQSHPRNRREHPSMKARQKAATGFSMLAAYEAAWWRTGPGDPSHLSAVSPPSRDLGRHATPRSRVKSTTLVICDRASSRACRPALWTPCIGCHLRNVKSIIFPIIGSATIGLNFGGTLLTPLFLLITLYRSHP